MSLVDYQSSSEESDDDSKSEKPITSDLVETNKIETLKRKEPVKILVPAIIEDEDTDKVIKKCKLNSSTGLLSMLPAPKYSFGSKTNTLTPYVLTKSKETGVPKKATKPLLTASTTSSLTSVETSEMIRKANSSIPPLPLEKKTASSKANDFFSLQNSDEEETGFTHHHERVVLKGLPAPIASVASGFSAATDIMSYSESGLRSFNITDENYPQTTSDNRYNTNLLSESPSQNDDLVNESRDIRNNDLSVVAEPEDIINDEQFRRLQGRNRGKKEINIIDVNMDEELPNKTEWHTKSLTEEKVSHSRNRNQMPTQQQRRKHQITYLAFQAKEREIDLKNQWAQNRLTKRETQAKYGF